MKTTKLFYENSYMREFTATVQSCEEKDGRFYVVLDQTAFFPEGGGQSGDTGIINGIPVMDTQEKDEVITHIMPKAVTVGETVTGWLNFRERFDRMQQHTGEHIVSGLVNMQFNYNNVGFHLGKDVVTMDFDGVLTTEHLREIEREANEAVAANLPVQVDYLSEEEQKTMFYRSKIEIDGTVRIITIPGYDVCACCAPHVKNTGEIGMIKLVDAIKYKGGTRVTMLCGFRALEDYICKEENVYRISSLLSAKPMEVADAVERLKEENRSLKEQLLAVQIRQMEEKAAAIPEDTELVFEFMEDMDRMAARKFVNEAMERCHWMAGIFFGDDAKGYQYILGSKTTDLREMAKEMHEALGGKGGGQKGMVQGNLPVTREEIETYFWIEEDDETEVDETEE